MRPPPIKGRYHVVVPRFTVLYVANPARSALFYRELFGHPPVEESPTFAMFVFESGARLALWSSATSRTRRYPECRRHGAGLPSA